MKVFFPMVVLFDYKFYNWNSFKEKYMHHHQKIGIYL